MGGYALPSRSTRGAHEQRSAGGTVSMTAATCLPHPHQLVFSVQASVSCPSARVWGLRGAHCTRRTSLSGTWQLSRTCASVDGSDDVVLVEFKRCSGFFMESVGFGVGRGRRLKVPPMSRRFVGRRGFSPSPASKQSAERVLNYKAQHPKVNFKQPGSQPSSKNPWW